MSSSTNYFVGILLISFMHSVLPEALRTLPATFTIGKYKLADHVLKHLKADSQSSSVIDKMKKYDDQLKTQQDKELFRNLINETTEKTAVSHQKLLEIVDNAFTMTNKAIKLTKPTKSLRSKLLTKSKATVSKLFKSETIESDIPELISKALHGDATAIESLHKINPLKLQSLSLSKKREILKNVQSQTDDLLNEINQHVSNQSIVLNTSDLENNKFEQSIKDLSLEHTASTLATMKYCQDVIEALKPMCSNSQMIMFTVDRHQINPLINFIDMKDFAFDPTATVQHQNAILKANAETLAAQGLLQIPQHVKTIPTFYEELRQHVIQYHSALHAKKIFTEIQDHDKTMNPVVDTQNRSSTDPVFEKHNFFKHFTPEYKEAFHEHLNKLLHAHETQQVAVEDIHAM